MRHHVYPLWWMILKKDKPQDFVNAIDLSMFLCGSIIKCRI